MNHLQPLTNASNKASIADANFTLLDTKLLRATATLDFPSVSAQSTQTLTATVTGAAVGDAVIVCTPAAPNAGIVFGGWVSAADTVSIRASNVTSGSIDPASATYKVIVLKY